MSRADEKPAGTKATKYAPAKDGPFRCDHCWHYAVLQGKALCKHSEVVADPEMTIVEVDRRKYAKVDPGGCCEYEKPIGDLRDIPFGSVGL